MDEQLKFEDLNNISLDFSNIKDTPQEKVDMLEQLGVFSGEGFGSYDSSDELEKVASQKVTVQLFIHYIHKTCQQLSYIKNN